MNNFGGRRGRFFTEPANEGGCCGAPHSPGSAGGRYSGLPFQGFAQIVQLAVAAEHGVFMDDILGVFGHEDLARRPQIEVFGMGLELLAVDPAPDEAAVGIDIDLADAELGGLEELVFVDALGALEGAAGGVDAGHFVLRDGAGTVHDEGEAGEPLLDFREHIEVNPLFAGEFEGAVAGADGAGEAVAAGAGHEILGLVGIGQVGLIFAHRNMFLDTAELAEFGFDDDARGMGGLDDAPGDLDVFLVGLVAGIDHDRAIEAAVDAIDAGGLVAMVQMDGEDGVGKDLVGGAQDGFEHALVGIGAGALGDLDDEGGLALDAAAEEAHGLFRVVDVIGADGIFAIGMFEEFFGGDDHE